MASPTAPTRRAPGDTRWMTAAVSLAAAVWLPLGGVRASEAKVDRPEAPIPQPIVASDPQWRGPAAIVVEPEGETLLVLCEKSGTVARLNADTGAMQAESPVGEGPFAMCVHPAGDRVYVSCRRGQEVAELDRPTLQRLRSFPLRGDPTGAAVSADGERLYAAVHSLDQVAVFDLESGSEVKRLVAGNGPESVRLDPQRKRVYVTNLLPNRTPYGAPCLNEITVIDDETSRVVRRVILEGANVGRGIVLTRDGGLAIAAISRPKNLVPMVQVARGWVVTNGFALVPADADTPPMQLLLDLPNQAFADPYAVAITPDDRKFYVSCAGVDRVLAVDLTIARQVMAEAVAGAIPRPSDHLGLSRRYVSAWMAVGAHPVALALSPDGRRLFVANKLDDSISVIDTDEDSVLQTIALGETPPPDRLSRGERLFHSAARTFQKQFSCASCHPDNGLDGLQYDMEPDGVGMDFIDNRNMRGVVDTGPFKWIGTNPDIATQCGTRTAKWIVRTGWLDASHVVDLVTFIHSVPPVFNPYRSPDGKLTAAQKRGRDLFYRTQTNDGRPLTDLERCDYCHSGPKFTGGDVFDVGTKGPNDAHSEFDTAHLINVFESAPYLHDGRAATLEELWTKFNPDDLHGVSNDWNKQQLNDLVEYLKSL